MLKKYEGHGDTTALKGAVLGRLAVTEEEKQEAVDLCKRGVASNMSNKGGWILLARLYRLLQRYEDSIKAYKNALNLKVVKWVTQADRTEWKRDLATMLSQTRQWPEVAELRRGLMLEGTNDALSQMAGYLYVCSMLWWGCTLHGAIEARLATFLSSRTTGSNRLGLDFKDGK